MMYAANSPDRANVLCVCVGQYSSGYVRVYEGVQSFHCQYVYQYRHKEGAKEC